MWSFSSRHFTRLSIDAELRSLVKIQYARIPPALFGLWLMYNYTPRFIVRQRTTLTFILYPVFWEYIFRCEVFDETADMKVIHGSETDCVNCLQFSVTITLCYCSAFRVMEFCTAEV